MFLKLFMQIDDYTYKFAKLKISKLFGNRDIYIQKCVTFGGKLCYFDILNILQASNVI